ncbi:MAG: type II toxin-antitoxin system HicA family toxin [Caldibacillus debilis]|jgi:hypothetical protein|uniref:Type II toxin-antitoxin system HicA family toxin n=1 Tax=Caldibacillus debilis TaxID=301148 RepID=A0A3E0JZS4_9BACI|nr:MULTISPECIES: hypothetical protein [Bacillaceae]MBO2483291.1 type II toxin-antitoxin system HicA family toxin [Bacillaceae bacterium]MBY6273821.1 type II toxin-antitoxin system HicA family toxin [Bacillaceae bacterium]OUM85011.1 MAG: hypothetical protein BAA00_21770 [Parageobacillus thermoglucosidasius]REJ13474.1 MAG: type II toxin-antitoxin system HicA family toxin [Caldibacillus debilis]REJ23375.1 MAG: type II toxin-antitoxin system HicA family toxin [Caldibacillus debilis]
MNPQKTKDIEAALLKKGFQRVVSHHIYYFLYVDGKKTSIRTKISHGIKEYDKSLLSQMAKQLKLPNEMFVNFIKCPLSYEDYLKYLRDKQILD